VANTASSAATAQNLKTLHVTTGVEWRRWLRANHKREREVLLVYDKAHTGKPRIPYRDALEEALCFGWIDAQVRRIDDDRYAQKWTPRRPGSRWSEINLRIAKKLIAEKRMTKAGLDALGADPKKAPPPPQPPPTLPVPKEFAAALRRNRTARANFEALAPGYRTRYLYWISTAKRDETRRKRITEAVQLLAQGVKSIMK
jgi:uncharacterized protein YdeI (YjbR/CyaY-like superfamily)